MSEYPLSRHRSWLRYGSAALLVAFLAPAPHAGAAVVGVDRIGRYDSGLGEGAAEIVAYDPASRRLFVVNAAAASVDVVDAALPGSPKLVRRIELDAWGVVANSVDVRHGIVAVAVEAVDRQNPGRLVFFDVMGEHLGDVAVGAVPDMVAFTPDGTRVLVANEAEPSDDYERDPEGSVSVVDLAGGVGVATVTTLGFADFNAGGPRAGELPAGVRIYGPGASVAQDLEPEYIAVSPDGTRAWVSLQENNALAILDLTVPRVERIVALGWKDHNLVALDPSDRDGGAALRTGDVAGMFLPDAVAAFAVGDDLFVLSANEGDARAWGGFSEETRVGDLTLDPTAYPDADAFQENAVFGRLRTTSATGDTDGDGDVDQVHAFGARSFSIWSGADGTRVFDSGDDFERITAAQVPATFNSNGDAASFDTRSDDKGPEPGSVAVGTIDGRTYAFIGLERTGGLFVYDVTVPAAAFFVLFVPQPPGDLSPEGLEFIAAADSPTGRPMLAVANEISGTVALYEIRTAGEGGATCVADGQTLCLQGGRFEVRASFRAPQGATGLGHAETITGEAGYFWFFREDNVEVVVKVLDACAEPFERFWVFASGMTNVETELRVTDVEAGRIEVYGSPGGPIYTPVGDTETFATCP